MTAAYVNSQDLSFFSDASEQLNTMVDHLSSAPPLNQEHGDIEKYIQQEGHELLRRLLQGHLDLRALQETRLYELANASGEKLIHCRENTQRTITSLFGEVTVTRKRYSQRKMKGVHPLDKSLNLGKDQFSDGVRLRLAEQINHSAYDHVAQQIAQTTGAQVAKRQCLNLVQDMAQDFEDYYLQNRYLTPEPGDDLLVLTFDGKGIVMRPDSLRECTKKRAKKSNKLNSRLSAGEKRDRKRMAQVASVYTVQVHQRSAESIMHSEQEENVHTFRTPARNKRVWASVEREPKAVITEAFEEALQRDP